MFFRWNAFSLSWLLIGVALAQIALARDSGQWKDIDPAQAQFYQTLMQPDNPTASCCGSSDAYFADEVDTDAIGNTVAIITDTRDDVSLARIHIPVGTRITIPARKLRKVSIPNPTGHNVIFLSVSTAYDDSGTSPPGPPSYSVYCWEPVAKG